MNSSPSAERRRAFYEQHITLAVLLIVVLFVSPVLGLLLFGFPGLLLGVVVPAVAYWLLPLVLGDHS